MAANGIQESIQNGKPHPITRNAGGAYRFPLACLCVVALDHVDCRVAIPTTNGIELLVWLAGTQPMRLYLDEQTGRRKKRMNKQMNEMMKK